MSASETVDSGLIPSHVKQMTPKLVFTASLLDAQHQRDSVEKSRQVYLLCGWERRLYKKMLLLSRIFALSLNFL